MTPPKILRAHTWLNSLEDLGVLVRRQQPVVPNVLIALPLQPQELVIRLFHLLLLSHNHDRTLVHPTVLPLTLLPLLLLSLLHLLGHWVLGR